MGGGCHRCVVCSVRSSQCAPSTCLQCLPGLPGSRTAIVLPGVANHMIVCCPAYRPPACMFAMCAERMPAGCQCCQSPACMRVRLTEHLPACCQVYQRVCLQCGRASRAPACLFALFAKHLPACTSGLPITCKHFANAHHEIASLLTGLPSSCCVSGGAPWQLLYYP